LKALEINGFQGFFFFLFIAVDTVFAVFIAFAGVRTGVGSCTFRGGFSFS